MRHSRDMWEQGSWKSVVEEQRKFCINAETERNVCRQKGRNRSATCGGKRVKSRWLEKTKEKGNRSKGRRSEQRETRGGSESLFLHWHRFGARWFLLHVGTFACRYKAYSVFFRNDVTHCYT